MLLKYKDKIENERKLDKENQKRIYNEKLELDKINHEKYLELIKQKQNENKLTYEEDQKILEEQIKKYS